MGVSIILLWSHMAEKTAIWTLYFVDPEYRIIMQFMFI